MKHREWYWLRTTGKLSRIQWVLRNWQDLVTRVHGVWALHPLHRDLQEAGLSQCGGGWLYLKNMGHGRVGDDKCHLEGDILRHGVVDRGVLFFVCFAVLTVNRPLEAVESHPPPLTFLYSSKFWVWISTWNPTPASLILTSLCQRLAQSPFSFSIGLPLYTLKHLFFI